MVYENMCNGIDFVGRLDALLSEIKISRKDFGKMLGLSSSTMGSWKSRNILPPIETVCKIADFFKVSIEWLLTGNSYEASYNERGMLYRKNIRNRIYKTIQSKSNTENNADNETYHSLFFSNMPKITYHTLISWEKGYISLEPYVFEDIANTLGVSLDYLLTGNENKNSNFITFDNFADRHIYDAAIRNLNDLFCLDNLTNERRKLAKDMLNQLMQLEHLEYVEKNKKDNQ